MQTQDSQQVTKRFFQALRELKERKVIRGKQTFTRRYNINRWNMNTLEKNLESDMFQAAWLTYLVRDYGVSATWLLTGAGEPLPRPAQQESPIPEEPKRGRGRKKETAAK